jgi:hypothetical protein
MLLGSIRLGPGQSNVFNPVDQTAAVVGRGCPSVFALVATSCAGMNPSDSVRTCPNPPEQSRELDHHTRLARTHSPAAITSVVAARIDSPTSQDWQASSAHGSGFF